MCRPARLANILKFLAIHLNKQVKSDQPKVHRASCRIENSDFLNRFQRSLGRICWNRDKRLESVSKLAVRMHGQPKASEAVLNKETNNPARREDLSCSRNIRFLEFLLFLEHPIKRSILLFCDEELIEPANGLLVSWLPGSFHVFRVKRVNDFPENTRTGEEQTGQILWVEQNSHFLRQFSTLPKEKMSICALIRPFAKVIQT